jgi:hypothetical protein
MLHERHWTPDEANQLRPIVGAIVRRLRAAREGEPLVLAAGDRRFVLP